MGRYYKREKERDRRCGKAENPFYFEPVSIKTLEKEREVTGREKARIKEERRNTSMGESPMSVGLPSPFFRPPANIVETAHKLL